MSEYQYYEFQAVDRPLTEEEQREMRRIAGDAVELWPVATIDEAVERLAPGGLPAAD